MTKAESTAYVNQAFKDATREIQRLNTELSGMQTFLAAILNTMPGRSFTVTKPMIDELHRDNLAEIDVSAMSDKSFVLSLTVPKEEPPPSLIIQP